MNEKLPYEKQLEHAWDSLSLPDEDIAWKDMKRRLDEDDDDKIVVPPPRRGCGIGALLMGLLLLSGLWFLLRPEKWFTKKETAAVQQTNSDIDKKGEAKENEMNVKESIKNNDNGNVVRVDSPKEQTNATKQNGKNNNNQSANIDEGSSKIQTPIPGVKNPPQRSEPLTIKNQERVQTGDPTTKKKNSKKQLVRATKPNDILDTRNEKNENRIDIEESVSDQKKKEGVENVLGNKVAAEKNDSVINETKQPLPGTDTPPVTDSSKNRTIQPTVTNNKDSIIKNTDTDKQKDNEEKPIFFSAGLGLHQQIPIAGQEWTTYGSLGRKGILTDYIPSVNFRMEKQDRWFLQTEFRYGAPQHTKQVTYEQKIVIDTFTQSIITNSSVLKKTFYHQVPLTFNYYILPAWSIGTGLQWNKFQSAVAEQEVKRRRPGTIDSIISKSTVKISNDSSSALVKSWFQGIIQTQYQWKRFSIGARYSFGLQPYIKFTLPNQPLQQEKNSSLQIFLRYELWRSKLRD